MSIKSKEDLLNKQAEVNEQIKSYTCRVLKSVLVHLWLKMLAQRIEDEREIQAAFRALPRSSLSSIRCCLSVGHKADSFRSSFGNSFFDAVVGRINFIEERDAPKPATVRLHFGGSLLLLPFLRASCFLQMRYGLQECCVLQGVRILWTACILRVRSILRT